MSSDTDAATKDLKGDTRMSEAQQGKSLDSEVPIACAGSSF